MHPILNRRMPNACRAAGHLICAVVICLFLFESPYSQGQDFKLRVMAWNIQRGSNHFDNGPEKALKVIRDSGAELLLLQESYDVEGDRPTLGRWLAKQLAWQVYQDKSPHLCIVSKYPIDKTFFHHDWHGIGAKIDLPNDQSLVAYSIWIDYRSYVASHLRDNPNATNAELIACETEKSNRMNQAKAIVAHLKEQGHLDADLPLLVGGDWNCPSHLDWTAEWEKQNPEHRRALKLPVSELMQDNRFVDTYRSVYKDPLKHPGNTWSPLYRSDDRGPTPQDRIDRIYYFQRGERKTLNPVAAQTLPAPFEDEKIPQAKRQFPSDHCAVLIDFEFDVIGDRRP